MADLETVKGSEQGRRRAVTSNPRYMRDKNVPLDGHLPDISPRIAVITELVLTIVLLIVILLV